MEDSAASSAMSVGDYLEMEKTSTVKHEYVAGMVYAMTGASRRHNVIANNISSLLWNAARGGACQVFQSDMKVRAFEDAFYYPDVVVSCEVSDDEYTEHNPCLVVEVVSPSTEMTDRREKLAAYKRMPGIGSYLIFSQDRRWVERHFRDDGGEWHRADLFDAGEFAVPCPPGATLSLAETYGGVSGL